MHNEENVTSIEEVKKLEGQARMIRDWIKQSQSRMRIEAAIALARSRPEVQARPANFDQKPMLFNVENGTIELDSGTLHEHRREDMLTKLAPVKYNPAAKAPTWERFLLEIMDGKAHLVEYLRRVFGYCMTGDVREDALWICHGGGANGKSTLLDTISYTMGREYAAPIAPDLLMEKRGEAHPTGLADLFGMRMVYTHEIDEGKKLAEGLTKQLTGRDRIKARRMREDFWDFAPTHKIILATNHKPEITGTDYAIWRRIRLVPFDITFTPELQDKELPAKLRAEREGILVWLVSGAVEWCVKGLEDPPEVQAATKAYRDEADPLADFLAECCVTGSENYRTKAGTLFESFTEWHRRERGGDGMSGVIFARRLAEKFYKSKTNAGAWYTGVALRANPEELGTEG